MPDNKQPIEYYVAEAKRLGLPEEQQSVIGDETDGQAFREHIANAHDKSDDELRDILAQEWSDYTADPKAAATSFDRDYEAEDEANGRHANSEPEGDEDDADELDDEDDDFGSDVGEDDENDDFGSDEEDEDEAGYDDSDDDSSTEDGGESSDEPEEDSLDHLDIDEDAIEQKRNGGGEALDDDEADCEGCKI